MIRSEFVIRDNKISAFSVEGHSGLADRGSDILCASVSAMTSLVLNTLTEVYGAELDLTVKDEVPLISCRVLSVPDGKEESILGTLEGFYLQMQDLAETYPTNLSVRTKK